MFHFNAMRIVVDNADLVLISPIGIIIIVSVALEVHGLIMVQLAVTMCHVQRGMVHVVEDAVSVVQDIIPEGVQAQFAAVVLLAHILIIMVHLVVRHVQVTHGLVVVLPHAIVHRFVLLVIITRMILI